MHDVLILRHGETAWNREARQQGSLDSPLTSLGRVQAARQGAILRTLGRDGGPVLCSPLGRARATAALAGLRARPEPRLREIGMGGWEGRTLAEINPPPGVTWKFEAPGGEGLPAFVARLDAVLAEMPGGAVLITHGVVAIALRARLLGLPVAAWDDLTDPQGVVFRVGSHDETLLR
jgi:probable phosphoglycerate mutase